MSIGKDTFLLIGVHQCFGIYFAIKLLTILKNIYLCAVNRVIVR